MHFFDLRAGPFRLTDKHVLVKFHVIVDHIGKFTDSSNFLDGMSVFMGGIEGGCRLKENMMS